MSLRLGSTHAGTGIVSRIPGLLYGGDYSPEQWPEDVWAEDARLMQAAGVNLVSLGIFAWSRIQRASERYDFAWLDRVIDLLHSHGVSVNLATPTASPPPWLVRQHPEILPTTADGVVLGPGSRRHYCPDSPAYREAAARVVRTLAERYRDHPALAMWHIDNEYACHVTECFCQRSAAAFRDWLRDRHGSLEALNAAWGTAFWSQEYGDWDEIEPPRRAPTFLNPSQLLDWRRFCSDSWFGCFRDQASILREVTPGIPITTNFMGFHGPLDYWKWAAEEDVVSDDSYPDPSDPEWMVGSALSYDLMRSLGWGSPWVLMEQASAHVNWRDRNATKRPGMMRLGSYQAIAHGADGVMFFQWRASRAGVEKHHSAMLPHAGTDTRTWREVTELGAELARCGDFVGSRVVADVAILFDWENMWALESGALPSNALHLLPQIRAIYAPLFRRQVAVDLAHPQQDLSKYRLVIVPTLYLTSHEAVGNLTSYVQGGGTVLMTFFSGIVDRNDHIRLGDDRQPFRKVLGLEVEEFTPLAEGQTIDIVTPDGASFAGGLWSDILRLTSAEAVAYYADDYYAGSAAVTRNRFGKGTAMYAGTMPDEAGMEWLLDQACKVGGVRVGPESSRGIEVVRRTDGRQDWLFVLNHTSEPVDVPLDRPGVDVLGGDSCEESVRVGPRDVVIIRSSFPGTGSLPLEIEVTGSERWLGSSTA